MAISSNWKNLKSFLRKSYNKEVNEWFRDVDDPLPDNSTGRKQAKRACLILPKESQNMALIKTLNFRYNVQQVHTWSNSYGLPIEGYQEAVTFRPQVHLFFRQDMQAVPAGRRSVEGQIGFRLMDETPATMTEAKAKALALKIKQEFTPNNGYIWKKGKKKYTYFDRSLGLDLRILSISDTEGKQLINRVLDILGSEFIDDYFQEIIPQKDSMNNPQGTNLVYGKQRKKQRWRPTANLRFRYATLTIHGMQNRIVLVDRTKTFFNAIEWV